MHKEVKDNRIILTADNGKKLERNGIFVDQVTIGFKDSEDNWLEISEEEVNNHSEITAEMALNIITGQE